MNHDIFPPWAALLIYVAGFVITSRIMFATSDGEDRGEDRFFAVCVGLIWPIAALIFIVIGLVSLPTLGAKTRRDRYEAAAQAAKERENLATRIAELEAENGRLRGEQDQRAE